jgi:signal transduction histidine kinase
MTPPFKTSRIVIASLVAAGGLLVVGWFDYAATRSELLQLLREQAQSLRQTIAAAARSNQAAGVQAERQVSERLLDNARLLAEIDRHQALDQKVLDQIAARNRLFRVAVIAPDGELERSSGGFGYGFGFGGGGRGFPAAPLLQRVLSGTESELVGQLHSPRWGGGARMAAAVRRAKGGAILLNADATEIEALQKQVSLDSLVRDIAATTAQLAYVSLDHADLHITHGTMPEAGAPASQASPAVGGGTGLAEHELMLGGRPVIEFVGPVALGGGVNATLRLGLRLDGLRRAEGRLLTRLVASLAAALSLSLLALGTVWLRQSYVALSEKHALAEAALRRRDRLSAMGELASTVAHEVRNPLNAIGMSVQRLRREYPAAVATESDADREEMTQLLQVVEGETKRINAIVQQFLEFARPPRLAPRDTDLGAELQSVVDAAHPLAASRGVRLDVDATGAGSAVVDAGQLRQVLDNLLRNAIEATPEGGRVTVVAKSGSKGHTIAVRDTGVGIAPEDLPRIFDLYFTTKLEGTGVGLAVSQQIVSAHGGTIEVDSKPGEGTSMTIRLPLVPEGGTRV